MMCRAYVWLSDIVPISVDAHVVIEVPFRPGHPETASPMNDFFPLAIFAACLFATFGLVRVCEWLLPAGPRIGPAASDQMPARQEGSMP